MVEPIKGYRNLSETEIAFINNIKGIAEEVGRVVDVLLESPHADKRWVSVAKTDLQKGFMALVRSIAKPEGF